MSVKKKIKWILIVLGVAFLIYKLSNGYTRAYWFKTTEQIESQLEKWNSKDSSNYADITNDTIRTIYDIFKVFYTPRELSRIGESEWGDSLYLRSKYMIVQNAIEYSILPNDNYFDTTKIDTNIILSDIKQIDSIKYFEMLYYFQSDFASNNFRIIKNFKPETVYDPKVILYLNGEQRQKLIGFLGKNKYSLGIRELLEYSNILTTKQDFLEPYFKIDVGHWGGWHIITHPYVFGIVLNSEMNKCEVSFRILYQFGSAQLEKVNDKWTLIDSELTGIE